jgi:hypothetical protein
VDVSEPAGLARDDWLTGICTRRQNRFWLSWPRNRDTNQPRAAATLLDTDQLRTIGRPSAPGAKKPTSIDRERNELAGGSLGEGNHFPILQIDAAVECQPGRQETAGEWPRANYPAGMSAASCPHPQRTPVPAPGID